MNKKIVHLLNRIDQEECDDVEALAEVERLKQKLYARRRKLDKSLLKNEELLRLAPVPNATSEALSTELNQQALMSQIESRIEQLFSAIDVSSIPSRSQITAQSHKIYDGLQSLFDEITSVVHFSKRFGIQHGWLEFEIAPIVNNILNNISTHITDQAPSVEYQYIAYNSLHFMASQLTSLDQMIPSPTREITSVVISIQKMMESLKSNMVQTHYDFCYTYFMADVEISEWTKSRPFLAETRCSYGIEAWYLYMKGIAYDLLMYCEYPINREIIGEVLIRCLHAFLVTYRDIFPSRMRCNQYKCDITYLIMYARSLRSIVPKHMKCEMNQYCVRLAVHLAIMCAPLRTLISFFETDIKSLMTESSHFSSIFTDMSSSSKYFSGLQADVWRPNKIVVGHWSRTLHFNGESKFSQFDPLAESVTIGSSSSTVVVAQHHNNVGSNNPNPSLDHKKIWDMTFNYRLLLTGCYVTGISMDNLIQRIQYRPEFFRVVPEDYPPLSQEEEAQRALLERTITQFSAQLEQEQMHHRH